MQNINSYRTNLVLGDNQKVLYGKGYIEDMDTTDSYLLSNARTQYQRIAETVGGEVVEGNGHGYFVKLIGKLLIVKKVAVRIFSP